MKFEFRWDSSDVSPYASHSGLTTFDIHFRFTLLFSYIPPGEGHAAHFSFNVLSPDVGKEEGISMTQRGYIICESFSYSKITEEVEKFVDEAFSKYPHDKALEILNTRYIYSEIDYSSKFLEDLKEPKFILDLIDYAFDGVERGSGITLQEAEVEDDYGSEEEKKNARTLAIDTRWQDISEKTLSDKSFYWMYLDIKGYCYYLPAMMSWGIRTQNCGDAYQSLLPLVAPRDVGRGHGEKFDVLDFIKTHNFSLEQVKAIYFFLVFASIKGRQKVSEDDYPAMLKWKKASRT